MLQPLQLEDVSVRHAGDIAELRDFFCKAGIAVEMPRAVHAVVAMVREDRGFHRDFTSHVWVLLSRAGRQAAYPDLLAVVALAAAGVEFAPTAAETDAHDLLRFLMEAIRSLDAEQEEDHDAGLSPAVPVARAPEAGLEARLPERAVVPQLVQPQPRAAWVVAAVCLLVAVTLGVLLVRRSGPRTAPDTVRAPVSGAAGEMAADEPAVLPSVDERELRAGNTTVGAPAWEKSKPVRARVLPERIRVHAAPIVRVAPPAAEVTRVAPSASFGLPVPARGANSSNAPVGFPRAAAPGTSGFKIVPADVLSRRIGARGVPAYAEEDARNAAAGQWSPRLVRHQPAWQGGNETELVAEMQPPARPGAMRAAASAGVVRSESLGIMAGNVLYSPSPAYPAAASAARVQGEVRLQAEVDRDGNVTDARVVSGPPLLRDAALRAVQHWRYRPWLSQGKPVPMTAAALLEFELP